MKKSTTIIIVIVLVFAAIAYFYFEGGSTTSTSLLQNQNDAANGAVGAQVLSLLGQIPPSIDTTLFTNPAYLTLIDRPVIIPPVNIGRPNPFAPLPGIPLNLGTNVSR